MSMVTRCPACDTVFRVTAQQLQAHRGQVRCGRCMTVFDGFKALATLPDQDPLEPAASVAAQEDRGNGESVARTAATPRHTRAEPAPVSQPASSAHAAAVIDPAQETAADPGLAAVDWIGASGAPPSTATSPEQVGQEPEGARGALPSAAGPVLTPVRASPAWSAGTAFLLALLVAQAAYAYRVDLVANYPGLKPLVAQLCGILGCSVPLPQQPRLINIEASDLQVVDPVQPAVIQLTATLRNHAGYEVGFPALDLVLTNTKEHTLARRIFMPDEYLEAGRNAAAGFAANAEITVRLVLDTGGLGAAGFRLALLPAHVR